MNSPEQFSLDGSISNFLIDIEDLKHLEQLVEDRPTESIHPMKIDKIELFFESSNIELRSFADYRDNEGTKLRGSLKWLKMHGGVLNHDISSNWLKYISINITQTQASYNISGIDRTWVAGKKAEIASFLESKQQSKREIPFALFHLLRFASIVAIFFALQGLVDKRYLAGSVVLLFALLGYLAIDVLPNRLSTFNPSSTGLVLSRPQSQKPDYAFWQTVVGACGVIVALVIGVLNLLLSGR